jgi:hypothetical protein
VAAKPKPPPTLQPVNLGSAAPFAVFGGSGVSCTGNTVITGDVGVYPIGGDAVTGFFTDDGGNGPCKVKGNIQDNDTGPETTAAQHAAASLGIAINDAQGRPCPATQVPSGCALAGELSGLIITPGVYINSDVVNVSGPVYLSGPGVYIFQIAGGLIVNSGTVTLTGGATAANVFWVTTQATLSTALAFEGNILSTTSITFPWSSGGTALTGRALALKNVTFANGDTVTLPK